MRAIWKHSRTPLLASLALFAIENALAWVMAGQDVLSNVISGRLWWLGPMLLLLLLRLLLYFVMPTWLLWRLGRYDWRAVAENAGPQSF